VIICSDFAKRTHRAQAQSWAKLRNEPRADLGCNQRSDFRSIDHRLACRVASRCDWHGRGAPRNVDFWSVPQLQERKQGKGKDPLIGTTTSARALRRSFPARPDLSNQSLQLVNANSLAANLGSRPPTHSAQTGHWCFRRRQLLTALKLRAFLLPAQRLDQQRFLRFRQTVHCLQRRNVSAQRRRRQPRKHHGRQPGIPGPLSGE